MFSLKSWSTFLKAASSLCRPLLSSLAFPSQLLLSDFSSGYGYFHLLYTWPQVLTLSVPQLPKQVIAVTGVLFSVLGGSCWQIHFLTWRDRFQRQGSEKTQNYVKLWQNVLKIFWESSLACLMTSPLGRLASWSQCLSNWKSSKSSKCHLPPCGLFIMTFPPELSQIAILGGQGGGGALKSGDHVRTRVLLCGSKKGKPVTRCLPTLAAPLSHCLRGTASGNILSALALKVNSAVFEKVL